MRKRSSRNEDLPPGCDYLPSGSVRLRVKGAATQIIGTKHSTRKEIWDTFDRIQSDLTINSLEYVADEWYKSHNFTVLKPRTQSDYKNECSKLPLKAFERWDVSQIEPSDVYKYMQARSKTSIRRANLELVWLRHVLGFSVSMGILPANPCRDIKPLRQTVKQSRRYVSDFDYLCMYAKANDACRVAMEISYCTGIRQGDVLKLRWDDINDSILIEEGKTGNKFRKSISPRLSAALEAAKKLSGHRFGGWVVRNSKGTQYTSSGFQTNWKRAKKSLPKHRQFTYHEIRHKAITDALGDKQLFSMHSDARMMGVYDHELVVSPSH